MARTPAEGADARPRKTTYSAPALENAFDILEELARAPFGLTVSEMSQRLGRSIGGLFRIMMVMERRGWLARDPDSDRFSVTPMVLELAYHATPAQELTRAAPPVMDKLSRESGQSCHLVVPAGSRGLVVLREAAPGSTSFALRLGAEVDLLTSCSGHVLLAFAGDGPRETMLQEIGEIGPKARRELMTMVERVRRQGHEAAPSARIRGVTDVSFPVFGLDGGVVAALTSPFLKHINGSQRVDLDRMRTLLRAAAGQISQALGWSQVGLDPNPASAPRSTGAKRKAPK